jgi:hypothetical protein
MVAPWQYTKISSEFGGGYDPSSELLRKTVEGGRTLNQAFAVLLADLEISEVEQREATRQQKQVRERLDERLKLEDSFLSGSYRRRTQIRPCDDIDLLAVLNVDWYMFADAKTAIALDAQGAKNAIDFTFDALRDAYPKTELRRFDRGVQLQFAGTGIGFDVVPALRFTDNESFIPDRKRGIWIRTNPKEQQRLMSEANQGCCGQMLVPLVKLLKTWNDTRGKSRVLRGFHLEAMAYHGLHHTPDSYREGVEYLLRDAAARLLISVPDIWPSGEDAISNLTWDERLHESGVLLRAADKAREALDAEADLRFDDAHAIWNALLGSRYPETGTTLAKASPLPAYDAVAKIQAGAYVSASSYGLVSASPSYAGAYSPSDHGGELEAGLAARLETAPMEVFSEEAITLQLLLLEHQIMQTTAQFESLVRMTAEKAAADPTLWPVTAARAQRLYAVLVGEQRTNFGRHHRLLVTVPIDLPAIEPRVYLLGERWHTRPSSQGWGRVRPHRHRWADGALCTHAMRDRWDGRLVTALVYAVDYLVRLDYYDMTHTWIGREIGRKGHLRINRSRASKYLGRNR